MLIYYYYYFFMTLFNLGTSFLCSVQYFPSVKKSNPEIYKDEIARFLRSKAGKTFLKKYGRGKFSHDQRMLTKPGGVFSVVKCWVRARENPVKVAKTIKWCKDRVSTAEQQLVPSLVANKQHNRLQSMVSREHINLGHPFVQRYSEVVVSETRPMGFIINLNTLEKPENFEMVLKLFFSSSLHTRDAMSKSMKLRKKIFN